MSLNKRSGLISLFFLITLIILPLSKIDVSLLFPTKSPEALKSEGDNTNPNQETEVWNHEQKNVRGQSNKAIPEKTAPSLQDNNNITISLIDVANNSIVMGKANITVLLDPFATNVSYNFDGGENTTLVANITIPDPQIQAFVVTCPKVEGNHTLFIFASTNETVTSTKFVFTIDSTPISIVLNSPSNASLLPGFSPLNITFSEEPHETTVLWRTIQKNQTMSISSQSLTIFPAAPLYSWVELLVHVRDEPGNWNSSRLLFNSSLGLRLTELPSIKTGNGSTFRGNTQLEFEFSEMPSTKLFSWDSGSNSSILDPVPSSEGAHSLSVYLEDSYRVWHRFVYEITVDNTPPKILLESPTNNSKNIAGSLINITFDEAPQQVSTVWDAGPQNISSIPQNNVTTTLLDYILLQLPTPSGWHSLKVTATDAAGNQNNTSYRFYSLIDVILGSPLNESIVEGGTPVNISFSENPLTKLFSWDLDTLNSSILDPIPLLSGTHVLHVFIEDQERYWRHLQFTFFSLITIQLQGFENNSFQKTGTFLATSFSESPAEVKYTWDSSANTTSINPLPGSHGENHTLNVFVRDPQNRWNTKEYLFYNDDLPIGFSLSSPLNKSSHTVEFVPKLQFNETPSQVKFSWDSSSNITIVPRTSIVYTNSSGNKTGLRTLKIWSFDAAGNALSKSFTFYMLIGIFTPFQNNTVLKSGEIISFSLNDTPTSLLTSWNNETPNAVTPSTILNVTVPILNDGPHELRVLAVDSVGNSSSLLLSILVDNTPVWAFFADNNTLNNDTYEYRGGILILVNLSEPINFCNVSWVSGPYFNGTPVSTDEILNQTEFHQIELFTPEEEDNYSIFLVILDRIGETITQNFSVRVDNTGIQFELLSPRNGTRVPTGFDDFNFNFIETPWKTIYQWDSDNSSSTIPIIPSTEENHSLLISISDRAGNWNNASYLFRTDSTVPEFYLRTLNYPLTEGESVQGDTSISIYFEEDEKVTIIIYRWDLGENQSDITDLKAPSEEENYTLWVFAKDEANNTYSQTLTLVVDNTAISRVWTSMVNNSRYVSNIEQSVFLKIYFSEEPSSVNYRWGNGNWRSIPLHHNISLPFSLGEHYLQINAYDRAGNLNTTSWVFINYEPTAFSDFITLPNIIIGVGVFLLCSIIIARKWGAQIARQRRILKEE